MSWCYKPKKIQLACLIASVMIYLLAAQSCSVFRSTQSLDCVLVELAAKAGSDYYEAVIRLDSVDFENAFKSRFQFLTPTRFFEGSELAFIDEGQDPDLLEAGDTFVVPLQKPDWAVSVQENGAVLCFVNFWERLPASDQFHPIKTEAMDVALGIEIDDAAGLVKPLVNRLPSEWYLVAEELPEPENPYGTIQYQKLRADKVREEVLIQYTYLTEEEKDLLVVLGPAEALLEWINWAGGEGQVTELNGRIAVYWDSLDPATFIWSYRYAYVDGDVVVDVTVLSDPLEWIKSDQEKALERRTDKVFAWYGFDEGEDQILIEIRMNREGIFRRRLKTGETIEKTFRLEESEFMALENSLRDNRFTELQSRSGPPGGRRSFLTVQFVDSTHSVEMNNLNDPHFKKIEDLIRGIVLPKVAQLPI